MYGLARSNTLFRMPTSICEAPDVATYEPSDELRAAAEAFKAAEDVYNAALERLYDGIAAEVAKPTRPADIARFLGYHSGHVRRIARERGVAPHVEVEPPRRRAKADPHD